MPDPVVPLDPDRLDAIEQEACALRWSPTLGEVMALVAAAREAITLRADLAAAEADAALCRERLGDERESADDKPRPASATSGTTSTTPPMEAPMPEPITPISDEDMSILREWAENRGAVWPGILVLALLARLDAQTATIKHFTGWLKEAEARAEKFSYSANDVKLLIAEALSDAALCQWATIARAEKGDDDGE